MKEEKAAGTILRLPPVERGDPETGLGASASSLALVSVAASRKSVSNAK